MGSPCIMPFSGLKGSIRIPSTRTEKSVVLMHSVNQLVHFVEKLRSIEHFWMKI